MKEVLSEKLSSRPDYSTEMGRELAEEIKKRLKGKASVSHAYCYVPLYPNVN